MSCEDSFISKTECNFLFRLTFFGLVLRIVNLATSFAFAEPRAGTVFGIYSIFDMEDMMAPIYSFLVFSICSILLWRVDLPRAVGSILVFLPLVYFFDYWFIDSQLRIAQAAEINPNFPFKTFDYILITGSAYDVITLSLVNILPIWLITVVVRTYRGERRIGR